jgi:hypothetical protein
MFSTIVAWLYLCCLWVATAHSAVPRSVGGFDFITAATMVLGFILACLLLVKHLPVRPIALGLLGFVVAGALYGLMAELVHGSQTKVAFLARLKGLLQTHLDLAAFLLLPVAIPALLVRPQSSELSRAPGWIAVLVGAVFVLVTLGQTLSVVNSSHRYSQARQNSRPVLR